MVNQLARLWRWTGRPTETSRRWTILVTGGLVALGLVVYNNVRETNQETARAIAVDVARSEYLAELASFENSRDEYNRCIQRVEGRADLRSVLVGLADRLSSSDDVTEQVAAFLNEEYPELNPADCPEPFQPPVLLDVGGAD